MRPSALAVLCLVSSGLACSSGPGGTSTGSPVDAGGPPPGYLRFNTAAVTIEPGTSIQFIEWVQAPLDHDVDVVDITGKQSVGGHHAVLYATSEIEPVGTTQPWKDSDIVSAHFLGGIGGEGGSALALPAGAVFRLKAGLALALQTHYLNASATALQGTTQLDVKLGPTSPTDAVASTLANAALSFQVPADGRLQVNVTCKLGQDLSVLMFTNHLHQWGVSAETQLTDLTGAQSVLKSDPMWNPEWTTNPDFTKYTVASPLVLHAGETITTSCDWANTTGEPLSFPAEMCVFLGFYLGDTDVGCTDNGSFAAE
jgi:hypothetical protein